MSKAELRKKETAPEPPKPAKPAKEEKIQLKKLEPITFTSSTEKPPPVEELPEFQQKSMEAGPGQAPKTQVATLAEERKSGVSALAMMMLPLFELGNRAIEGGEGPSLAPDPKDLRVNKDDVEYLGQSLLLVDAKHGGPLAKTLGSEEGPEIVLATAIINIAIKWFLLWRISMARRKAARQHAPAGQGQEGEKPKTALEKIGESISKAVRVKEPEKKPAEEAKPEGTMSSEEFDKYSRQYMERAQATG